MKFLNWDNYYIKMPIFSVKENMKNGSPSMKVEGHTP